MTAVVFGVTTTLFVLLGAYGIHLIRDDGTNQYGIAASMIEHRQAMAALFDSSTLSELELRSSFVNSMAPYV